MTSSCHNNEVELRMKFQPSCLKIGENFGSQKVFQVFVICNNISKKFWLFQVVMLGIEDFKDYEEFLIIYVVVNIGGLEHIGMECN